MSYNKLFFHRSYVRISTQFTSLAMQSCTVLQAHKHHLVIWWRASSRSVYSGWQALCNFEFNQLFSSNLIFVNRHYMEMFHKTFVGNLDVYGILVLQVALLDTTILDGFKEKNSRLRNNRTHYRHAGG